MITRSMKVNCGPTLTQHRPATSSQITQGPSGTSTTSRRHHATSSSACAQAGHPHCMRSGACKRQHSSAGQFHPHLSMPTHPHLSTHSFLQCSFTQRCITLTLNLPSIAIESPKGIATQFPKGIVGVDTKVNLLRGL